MIWNSVLITFPFCVKILKKHLRILELSPGLARVQRGPRGPGSTLEQKVHILRFGAKRCTFCENELILVKFWLWAAPCRKACKRNGILVILEPQNGKSQLLGANCIFAFLRWKCKNKLKCKFRTFGPSGGPLVMLDLESWVPLNSSFSPFWARDAPGCPGTPKWLPNGMPRDPHCH